MSEAFTYSDETQEPARKTLADFTDEEILEIYREDTLDYDPDCGLNYEEFSKKHRKQLKVKYCIDSATLFDVLDRAREISKESRGGHFSFLEEKEKEHKAWIEKTFQIFEDLSKDEQIPPEPTQEELLLEMLCGVGESRPIEVPVYLARELLRIDDLSKLDLFQYIRDLKFQLGRFIEKNNESRSIEPRELQRLYKNFQRCCDTLSNYWFFRHANEIKIDSVDSLVLDPVDLDNEFPDQASLLDFALENTTGEDSMKAVGIALAAIEKDYAPYLETGKLVCPSQVNQENFYKYADHYEEYSDVDQLQLLVEKDYRHQFETEAYKLLGYIISRGNLEQSQKAAEILNQRWPDQGTTRFGVLDVPLSPYREFADTIVEGRGNKILIANALSSVSFDPKRAQPDSFGTDMYAYNFIANLEKLYSGRFPRHTMINVAGRDIATFVELERRIPGSAQRLSEDFNIDFPARYPMEIIIEMLEEETELRPYGIAIFPKADHNTAFHQDVSKLEQLHQQLRAEGYDIKISETDSGINLIRLLLRFNRKYGKKNKISFLILGGHGRKNQINFGNSSGGTIYTEDIRGQGLKRLADIFIPDATVILESCSTGQKDGIADIMSRFFNVNVVAPKNPTSVEEYHVNKTSSGIGLGVTYYNDDKSNFKKRK